MNGEQIRAAREAAGLTQQQLGDLVGSSLRTVGNWERGITSPRAKEGALRAALGDHLDQFEKRHPVRVQSSTDASASIAVDVDGQPVFLGVSSTPVEGGVSRVEVRYWPGPRRGIKPVDLLAVATYAHREAQNATYADTEGGEGHAGGPAATKPGDGDPDHNPGLRLVYDQPSLNQVRAVTDRYLAEAGDDAGEALSTLTHDGAEGAGLDPAQYERALVYLGAVLDTQRGPGEPGQAAARESKQPPALDVLRDQQDRDAERSQDEDG